MGRLRASLAVAVILLVGCGEPAPIAVVFVPGEYEVDYEATLRAIEAEQGRPLTDDERADVSLIVAMDGPFATFNADGTFAWDNRPDRILATRPDGVKVGTPLGWVGGSGTYRILDEDQLALDYEELSDSGCADALRGWFGRDVSASEYEEMRGDGPPLHVTSLGECHVHEIRGRFIRWRYGRNCEKFVLLRSR